MHLSVGAEYRNLNIRTAIAEKYKIHIHNMKGDSRFKILSGLLEGRSRFHDNHGITTSHLLKKNTISLSHRSPLTRSYSTSAQMCL